MEIKQYRYLLFVVQALKQVRISIIGSFVRDVPEHVLRNFSSPLKCGYTFLKLLLFHPLEANRLHNKRYPNIMVNYE